MAEVAVAVDPKPWPPQPGTNRRGSSMKFVAGLVRTARPKQWLKNLLVFAAPGAAGALVHGHVFIDNVAAFSIFCLTASGVYFINDASDADADRAHPRKRLRPVAAGILGVRSARASGAALLVIGLVLAALLAVKFLLVLAIYVGVQVAYSLWLKHQPVLDLAAVASGFVLRGIAGAVAIGVPISEWFLIVATFGSLFMVTGKRIADRAIIDSRDAVDAPTGVAYTVSFLQSILVMSASVTITAYCLWAFANVKATVPGDGHAALWFQLSIAPFVVAMMRYGLLVDQGKGGTPEDAVLADRLLLALGLIWVLLFALGVYS